MWGCSVSVPHMALEETDFLNIECCLFASSFSSVANIEDFLYASPSSSMSVSFLAENIFDLTPDIHITITAAWRVSWSSVSKSDMLQSNFGIQITTYPAPSTSEHGKVSPLTPLKVALRSSSASTSNPVLDFKYVLSLDTLPMESMV